jgi:hypothetical protein
MQATQSGEQKYYSRENKWKIQEVYGIITVTIPGEKKVAPKQVIKRLDEIPLYYPVPVYIMSDINEDLIGVLPNYISLSWKSPSLLDRETDENKLVNKPNLIFSVDEGSDSKSIRFYPLALISTRNHYEGESDETEEIRRRWGANEEFESPESAIFGPGTWTQTAWGTQDTYFENENGVEMLAARFPNCMFAYTIGRLDVYTQSFLTNHLIAPWTGLFADPRPTAPTIPIGQIQYWTERDKQTTNSYLSMLDDLVCEVESVANIVTRSVGNLADGSECESSTTKDSGFNDLSIDYFMDCAVTDNSDYPDKTYMILYGLVGSSWSTRGECSPWIHWPQENTLEYPPGPVNVVYNCTFKLKAVGKWGEIEYEFAPPVVNGTYDDLDQVEVWQAEIYDYHKNPVYIFTWADYRIMTANYGMIYNGEIYLSDPFPITNTDPCEHDVYGSVVGYGGYGSLDRGAKAAGIVIKKYKEEKIDVQL